MCLYLLVFFWFDGDCTSCLGGAFTADTSLIMPLACWDPVEAIVAPDVKALLVVLVMLLSSGQQRPSVAGQPGLNLEVTSVDNLGYIDVPIAVLPSSSPDAFWKLPLCRGSS